MTSKEQFDIQTMRYFIPVNRYRTRTNKADEQAMADLSSRGVQPVRRTKGFLNLLAGKTYRDEQITSYRRDVRLGYITKYEIISSFPKDMQDWITSKLVDVPYDEDGLSGTMWVSHYRNDAIVKNPTANHKHDTIQ